MNQDENNITMFARTNYRNAERLFGIKQDDRRRHMYLIGKTGMGKTTVIENMVISDIRAGNGVALVDPHGDLVENVHDYIPSYRINDVVYFNPADVEYPIGFNVLESVDPTERHLVASGLMGVFTKIWEGVWSARMEYILNNAILALLEYPGSTMLGIARILVDKKYRQKVVDKITDPVVKSFWVDEFANYNTNFRNEAIAPIQNKVGQFLSSSIIRNIVGQPKSTINLREIMDDKKILLMNLSKGKIGEDNSALLGAMMITRIQLAAMSRVDIEEAQRNDFYLYVDEFQNFATESFASILSEARKYRLNLILAHQYIEQLDENVRAAVFGNVGTIVCFRVGAADAEFLAKEFYPTFEEDDLLNITKYNVYLKLMIDGVASEPFSAKTLPPIEGETNNREKVVGVSRERYAKQKHVVEEKIVRWSGVNEIIDTSDIQPSSRRPRQKNNEHIKKSPTSKQPYQKKRTIPISELETVTRDTTEKTMSLHEALRTPPEPYRQKQRPAGDSNQSRNAQQHTQLPQKKQTIEHKPVNSSYSNRKTIKPGQVIRVQN